MSYCKVCKEEIIEGSKFCVKCGTAIELQEQKMLNDAEPINKVTVENIEKEEHRRKNGRSVNKKVIISLISVALVCTFVGVIIVIFMLSESIDKIDIGSFVIVEYEGYDTVGEADVKIDEEELIEAIAEVSERDKEEIEQDINKLIESFSYEIVDNGALTNGEKVQITITYDKDIAEKSKFELLNTTFTNNVVNLQELTEIDPFQYLKIKFEGCSGDGSVSFEKDITSRLAKDLNYELDKSTDLCNGDTITISLADSESEKGLKQGYKFISTTKEYEVSGLSLYYESLSDISENKMTVFNNVALEKIEEEYQKLNEYAVLSEVEYIGTYFVKDNQNSEYSFIIGIYKGVVDSPNDDYKETELYLPVKITNLSYDDNGSFNGTIGELHQIKVMDHHYKLLGYLSDDELYINELFAYQKGENSSGYTVESTEGVSNLCDKWYASVSSNSNTPEDDDSAIQILIQKYLQVAYIEQDFNEISELYDSVEGINFEAISEKGALIEECRNIKSYKLENVVLNASIVCFTYDVKISNIDTLLPVWNLCVVKYDTKQDKYIMHNMLNGDVYSEYYSLLNSVIVELLYTNVEERYQEALLIEPDLSNYRWLR